MGSHEPMWEINPIASVLGCSYGREMGMAVWQLDLNGPNEARGPCGIELLWSLQTVLHLDGTASPLGVGEHNMWRLCCRLLALLVALAFYWDFGSFHLIYLNLLGINSTPTNFLGFMRRNEIKTVICTKKIIFSSSFFFYFSPWI